MTERNPLLANRVRKIAGSFAFVEHRFLRDQFWHNLTHHELMLYFFLVLAADRQGVSFYGFDKICSILGVSVDHFVTARDGLIEKDLLAFDGRMFQVLSLPEAPVSMESKSLRPGPEMADQDPATIHQLIAHSLGVESG